ncbi:MAG: histidine kinase [Vicinamibacterales bacterium]|nr:histidine kinase [Vicinamibacterales bacterium]
MRADSMNTHPLHVALSLHFAGFLCGLALYGMLLALALRPGFAAAAPHGQAGRRRGVLGWLPTAVDPLPVATGMLGVIWNTGALVVYGMGDLGLGQPPAPFAAAAYAALGFLPAVAAHSILRPQTRSAPTRARQGLVAAAYAVSAIAAALHVRAAWADSLLPSVPALRLLTAGFVGLALPLVVVARREALWRRALLVVALAVFAVSAIHLVEHSDFTSPLWLQLLGHHASLPLAVAILLQDYPFAFADILLKRILAIGTLVAVALAGLLLLIGSPLFADARSDLDRPVVLTTLLLLATGIALVYPWLRDRIAWFVDTVVLRRADPTSVLADISRLAADSEQVEALMTAAGRRLATALSATTVSWRECPGPAADGDAHQAVAARTATHWESSGRLQPVTLEADGRAAALVVPTADPPYFVAVFGPLAGGRRLLSADLALLQDGSLVLARRLDAIRIGHERFHRQWREQEMARLATEAELRALRAQVNPHFLFNALTTIGYLVQTAPDQAVRTLLRLTDLLRRALRSDNELIALGTELELVEAYLDIEHARFEDRLQVAIDVPQDVRQVRVPPFLLQPLVENAVKHGIAPSRAGGTVSIVARVEDGSGDGSAQGPGSRTRSPRRLVLTVSDTGTGTGGSGRHVDGEGIGLANVERRLALAFGPGAGLSFSSRPGSGTAVQVVIPLPADAGGSAEDGVAGGTVS